MPTAISPFEIAVKVIEYYADKGNWTNSHFTLKNQTLVATEIEEDQGEKAREFLKEFNFVVSEGSK